MRDEGFVQRTAGEAAEVLVNSREACSGCAARALCSFNEKGTALLQALNPIAAQPGDRVEIEVPEAVYSRHFIMMFGVFLSGIVIGSGFGVWLAPMMNLATNFSGALGFFFGLAVSGVLNWIYFRKAKRKALPVILSILTPGGAHG